MVTRKRSKKSRHRGTWTHGWGEKKKHRNSGSRGGKGNAGSGKRADSKKPSFWKRGRKYNMGFTSKSSTLQNAINVGDIDLMIAHNKFEKKGSAYDVNLTALGYTKLLSKGKLKHPVHITVDYTTENATQKVTAAGGNVTVANKTK